MPPPGGLKREFAAPVDIDQPIDPNEPTYCVCHQVLLLFNMFVCFSGYLKNHKLAPHP